MVTNCGIYYLYRHIRLDKNEVFYIGIGTKNIGAIEERKEFYRAFNKSTRNYLWKRVVAKTEYKVQIILESDDLIFVKSKEIEFINLYKRKITEKGTLTNLTLGGDSGGNFKPPTKKDKEFVNLIINNVLEEINTIRKSCILLKWDKRVFDKTYKIMYPDNDYNIYKCSLNLLNKQKAVRLSEMCRKTSKKTVDNIAKIINLYSSSNYRIKDISRLLNIKEDLVGEIIKENLDVKTINKIKKFNLSKYQIKCKERVLQFDLNGNFIKKYENLQEVCEIFPNTLRSTFLTHFKGRPKSYKGFIWKLDKN